MKYITNTFFNNLYIIEIKYLLITILWTTPILIIEFNYFYNELILILFSFLNFFFYFIFSNIYHYIIIKVYFILTLTIFILIPIILINIIYYIKPIIYEFKWNKLKKCINFLIKLYWFYFIYQLWIILIIINIISTIILNQQLSIILELNPLLLINSFIMYTQLYIYIYLFLTILYLILKQINKFILTFFFKKTYYIISLTLIILLLIPDDLILLLGIAIYIFINLEIGIYLYFLNKLFK